MSVFDVTAYMGTWYELAHSKIKDYPTEGYNTSAVYTEIDKGLASIVNSTTNKGNVTQVSGVARYLQGSEFFVSFGKGRKTVCNYRVLVTWRDKDAVVYKYAVVTNPITNSCYVLSRTTTPCKEEYAMLMEYVDHTCDIEMLHTPHYV